MFNTKQPKTAAQILAPLHTKLEELRNAAEAHAKVALEKRVESRALELEARDAENESNSAAAAANKLEAFLGGDDANI